MTVTYQNEVSTVRVGGFARDMQFFKNKLKFQVDDHIFETVYTLRQNMQKSTFDVLDHVLFELSLEFYSLLPEMN